MFAFLLPLPKTMPKNLQLVTKASVEETLIFGLKAGHQEAIKQLYKMYSPALMGIIKRIVKFDEIAEDVLQDTFIKIWKSFQLYDPIKGRLFTWMANLARNTAIDQLRSRAGINSAKTTPLAIIDHQSCFQPNIDAIGIKNLLIFLKTDQKLIIDMIYFQGYTHVQTSEILNMPLGTVKTKIRLSILSLRSFFKEAKMI
jgi:RNA polymerase sigma factor (sigma-70 family)